MKIRINKEYIRTQLEALPYILAACVFAGALWFITSGIIIMAR